MNRRDSALAALVASIWGLNFVVIEWGMRDVAPLVFLALRFCVVVFPAVLVLPRPDAPWRTIASVGLLMSLGQFGFLYLSLDAGLSPGLAALVLQAQVIFTVVVAAVFVHERPSPRQVAGIAVGVSGLVVVALGRGGDASVVAFCLCLLGALSWGVGNVVSRTSGVASGLSLTVWSGTVVPLPALVLALLVDGADEVSRSVGALGWTAVASTLYTAGLASLVGYGVFNSLLARHPAAAVVPWVLLAPVVAMVSAAVLLGDVPAVAEVVGGVVMVVGVLVALGTPVPRSQRLAVDAA